MDVLVIPIVGFLAIYCILAVVFYYLLLARGIKKRRNSLIAILGTLFVLTTLTLLQVYQYYLNPLGPPPEIWSEWYSDSLYIRRMTLQMALFESLIVLFLSTSLVLAMFFQKGDDTPTKTGNES